MSLGSTHICLAFCVCFSAFLLTRVNSASAQKTSVSTPSNFSLQSNLPVNSPEPNNNHSTIAGLVSRKRWGELLELTQSLVAKSPTDPDAFYWHGIASFQLHKPIEAVQAFRTAEKLGLDNPALHEGLGLAYYDLNQFVLFEEQMKLAFRQDPNDFAPAYYLGLYRLSIQSDVGGALAYFREAVRLRPSDWKSLYQRLLS